jgi:hypothetical protein
MTEQPDTALERELLRLDVLLRTRQLWWEHPRNAAVVLGVIVAITAAVAGVVGWKIGTAPPQQIVVHIDQPLVVRTQ